MLRLVTLHFVLKRMSQLPHEKMQLLEHQSNQYDSVKISNAFALHLLSNSFKTMFHSGWKYASKLCIFSSFKKVVLVAKIMFFEKNLYSAHFNFTAWPLKWKVMISLLIWYFFFNFKKCPPIPGFALEHIYSFIFDLDEFMKLGYILNI